MDTHSSLLRTAFLLAARGRVVTTKVSSSKSPSSSEMLGAVATTNREMLAELD